MAAARSPNRAEGIHADHRVRRVRDIEAGNLEDARCPHVEAIAVRQRDAAQRVQTGYVGDIPSTLYRDAPFREFAMLRLVAPGSSVRATVASGRRSDDFYDLSSSSIAQTARLRRK